MRRKRTTRQFLSRLARNERGNFAMIMGLVAIPLLGIVGLGIDLSRAYIAEARLQGAVDSAALAAAGLNGQTEAKIKAITTNYFYNNYHADFWAPPGTPVIDIANQTVTISATATQTNYFLRLFGYDTFSVAATASALGTGIDMDFYLLLDSSPSMGIAATQSGINLMVANTPTQDGCAFACHETNPAQDNLGNPGGIDNFALARSLNVTLRIDLLRQAAQDLMTTASQTATDNHASYRMAIYTFDTALNTIQPLTSDLSLAKLSAGNIDQLSVYANNWLTKTNNNNDTDTALKAAMQGIKNIIPNPGNGTHAAGDTPQEVLFLVTDGVQDEAIGANRTIDVMNTNWCTPIKNRGVRIAVLYTSYLPLPTNAYYNAHVAPIQSQIAPALESCASPGLFSQINTGDDISAALAKLFKDAVRMPYLTK